MKSASSGSGRSGHWVPDWPEQWFPGMSGRLPQNSLLLPATFTAPARDQLSLFHVEFSFGHDFPPMKAALAQGFAFGFFLQGRLPEFNDLAHAAQMFSEKKRTFISDGEI
ncbi:MAG: hypothetical protein WB402_05890 [Sulfuricaulis sp.]|uniref:hypothetical protein n=1 Tax=Sulfuricaulis sp. TaxID=2003553 RepID=UPI003C31E818